MACDLPYFLTRMVTQAETIGCEEDRYEPVDLLNAPQVFVTRTLDEAVAIAMTATKNSDPHDPESGEGSPMVIVSHELKPWPAGFWTLTIYGYSDHQPNQTDNMWLAIAEIQEGTL